MLKIDNEKFTPWIDHVLLKAESIVKQISDTDWLTNGGLTQQGSRELRKVQQDMVVGSCDKSSHDMMIVCKTAYLHALLNEFQSGVYQPTVLTDDQIWDNHAILSTQIGRTPVKAHSYLYGAAKMHKDPAGMRWIAGCSRQEIDRQGERIFQAPATSISPIASALGAVLRFCMHQLERKDVEHYRPKGIRRYWIVTSVDAVAKHIKAHQKMLAQEQVITEDFTTMYTKLPPDNIKSGVHAAVKEAFEFFDKAAVFNLKWSRDGNAEVVFDDEGGFTQNHIQTWIQQVVDGTFIKASPESTTLHQVIGVPMGGKCSSELANLYCYSVESQTIDQLLAQGSIELVKSMYHTFRYIDDILTFGNNHLSIFPYGMEHRQTNDSHRQAVFLGMAIDTAGDFVKLKLQPKGAGWKWTPQRYVEWSSVHTKATKNHMLKGLLVRASTVTNTLAAFHEAVEYYVQGLFARGFTRKALHHGFQSYIHDYWNPFPHQQQELSKWFQALLNRTFGPTNVTPGCQAPQPQAAPTTAQGTLLCGLRAINYLMINQGRMPVDREILDDIADNVASLEAAIHADNLSTNPDKEGNYHVTVMSVAIKQLADLFVTVWTPQKATEETPIAYILGNGSHWQALVQENNEWFVRDQKSFKVQNLQNFLQVSTRRGMVLALTRQPPTQGDMDCDGNSSTSRKRTFQEVALANSSVDDQPTPRINPAAETIVVDDDDEEPVKKDRALQDTPNTQELLENAQNAFVPLPNDSPPNVTTRGATTPTAETQWVQTKVGVTPLLHCEATNIYRCIKCQFQSQSPLGVATHFGRYCNKQTNPKAEGEEEDII